MSQLTQVGISEIIITYFDGLLLTTAHINKNTAQHIFLHIYLHGCVRHVYLAT